MPRGKTKVTASAVGPAKKTGKNASNSDKNMDELISANIEFKLEPPEQSEEQPSPSKVDLSQFRFQKKQHVKIEFEKDSPEKEETKGLWEPANWKEFLLNLRNMRSNNDAPVDTMGCHMSGDETAAPEVYRYQCLISLMLSSQTKDQVTFAAMERLRTRGLTIDNVLSMSDDELGKLIYPVGFWKTKVKYIKKTTQTLKEQYNGDIPDSVDKLCKLTGVGPKMAHICMLVAWDKVTGIGVDTHVHRISNRIGWLKKPTSTPEDTRKSLQTWLPFELWSEVNHLLVGFGQTICLPIGPLCHECLNRDICPSSGLGRKSPKKTPVKKEVKSEKSDDENDVNPPKSRKVTPRKELNDENINSETKLIVKTETVEKKSPRKRKLTPIKTEQVNPEDDMEDFEMKPDQLSVKAALRKRVTPNKKAQGVEVKSQDNLDAKPAPEKRVIPNKKKAEEINSQENLGDFEMKTDELSVKAAPRKRVTPNKTKAEEANSQDNLSVKTAPKKRVTPNKKTTEEINSQDNVDDVEMKTKELSVKAAPKKRVTPNKKTKAEEVNSQNSLNVKTAPKKRVTTNKKKAEEINSLDNVEDFEMKTDQLSVKTAPKKRVTPNKKTKAAESNSQDNLDVKSAPKKKVTPNKKAKAATDQSFEADNNEDENDSQPNIKNKRAVKKKTVPENSDENLELKEPTTGTRNKVG